MAQLLLFTIPWSHIANNIKTLEGLRQYRALKKVFSRYKKDFLLCTRVNKFNSSHRHYLNSCHSACVPGNNYTKTEGYN